MRRPSRENPATVKKLCRTRFIPGSWVVWVDHYPVRSGAESKLPAIARTVPGAYVTLVRPRQAGGAPTG